MPSPQPRVRPQINPVSVGILFSLLVWAALVWAIIELF